MTLKGLHLHWLIIQKCIKILRKTLKRILKPFKIAIKCSIVQWIWRWAIWKVCLTFTVEWTRVDLLVFYYNLSQTKQRKTNCGARQSFIICKTRPSNTGRIFSKIEYRLKSPHPAVGVVQILINITTKACEEQQSCDVVIITTVCPLSFKLESKKSQPDRFSLLEYLLTGWC